LQKSSIFCDVITDNCVTIPTLNQSLLVELILVINYKLKRPFMVDNINVYRINAGSCNGCDVELLASILVPKFGFDSLQCTYTNTPEEANIVIVTGSITTRSKPFLEATLKRLPENKVVVAMGICPVTGGVFRDSYSIEGPLDRFVNVDVNIAGCPPPPQSIVDGLVKACALWKEKVNA
jgi:Ni,Fe-hydrogenase III small subunit